MIRAVVTYAVHRSIDRSRPVRWPIRAMIAASGPLGEVERRLRAADQRLRSSAAGLVEEPPSWLAPATVARLPRTSNPAPSRPSHAGRFKLLTAVIAATAGIGGLAAAIFIGSSILRVPPAAPENTSTPPIVSTDDDSSSTLVAAVLGTRDRLVTADPFTSPLRAEAERLRDDTRAAASFLIDRLRILGVQTQQ